jgi:uncharacterized membrane-anchored protein
MEAKKEYFKLVALLVILFAILGGFLLYSSYPLLSTKTAVLAVYPVDPFDVLRGQYIIIGYEIGRISFENGLEGASVGDKIYVILKEDDKGIFRYETASLTKPSSGLFIRGTVRSAEDTENGHISIQYGIEQYFFERNARIDTRGMTVKVKISSNGEARIVELLKDGKPLKIQYENKTLTS